MKITIFCFLSVFVGASVITGEPQCSPFHYHEQLLEKMIDVKYKMDVYSEKMENWGNVISEKLTKFDELSKQYEQFETRLSAMMVNVESYTNDTLMELSKSVEENLKQVKADKLKTPVVMFKARSVKNQSPSKGETLVFQKIVQNEGRGYDTDTGIFTAPVSGTYLFMVQFCLYHRKEISAHIIANGVVITAANFGDNVWSGLCTSTSGHAVVKQGHEVKVQVSFTYNGTAIYSDSDTRYWTSFSGVLLHV